MPEREWLVILQKAGTVHIFQWWEANQAKLGIPYQPKGRLPKEVRDAWHASYIVGEGY